MLRPMGFVSIEKQTSSLPCDHMGRQKGSLLYVVVVVVVVVIIIIIIIIITHTELIP